MANCICGTVAIALLLLVEFSHTQIESPCPDVFFYSRGAKGLYGDITVSSKLIENNKDLKVILSHEDPLPSQYQGYIELQEERLTVLMSAITKLNPIKYFVHFPQRTQYFYIQSIVFNGVVICSGAPPLKANRKIVLHDQMVIDESKSRNPTEVTTLSGHHNPKIAAPSEDRTHTKHNPIMTSPSDELTRIKNYHPTVAPPSAEKIHIKPYDSKIKSIVFSHFLKSRPFQPRPPTKSSRERRSANSEQNSDDNYISLYNKKQLQRACGKESTDPTRKWPWISAVYMEGSTKRWMVSSGALISDIFVITAAQPVSFLNNRPTLPKELSVRIGAYSLEDEDDESSSLRTVRDIVFHPKFKPMRLKVQDNIALLRIKPLNFNQFLAPVCLIRANRDIGSEMIRGLVIGWGKDLQNKLNIYSNEIEMEILPVHECNKSYPMIPRFLRPNNFCAQSEEVSQFCDEEQGKGFYTQKLRSTRWVLAGILTYSIQKFPDRCKIEKARVFSDLAKDADWIEDILFNENDY